MIFAGSMLFFLRHATVQQWVVVELLVSSVSAGTALILVTRTYGKPTFSSALLRRRVGEGVVFALSYSTTGIYNDVDKAMLGHFGMNAANGVYAMAYRVINVACMPFISLQAAAIPRFFQKGVNGVHSTAEFALRIVKLTVPIALLSTAIMLAAAPIIPHLVGKSFSESVSALRWLCLLPVFRSLHASAGDALTGADHQKMRLGSQATAAVFNFTTNLYLIPHYGWLGAAWASLASDGLLAVFNWTVLLWLTSKAETRTPPIAATVC
jgi:O-antigen/teichoic acid export membrane protein